MARWKICYFVQFIVGIELSVCEFFISKNAVEISYYDSRSDYCPASGNNLKQILGISLADCVIECGLRNRCLAIGYHHGMHSCLLLRSTYTDDVIDEQCDYILKSNMTVHMTPCANGCSAGLTCDIDTQACIATECPFPSPVNGKVLGNRFTIGSKVRYKCNIGHIETTDTYTGICLDDGTWSHVANCTEIWIVIQQRLSASDFYKTWEEYKVGFDDLNGNFWLGNENIWELTKRGTWKLRIELTWNGESGYADYSYFAIGNETSNYVLSVGGYTGTIGDSLAPRHDGMQFSTHDRDNDIYVSYHCAQAFVGGWWYSNCHDSNLNGLYGSLEFGKGLNWGTWKDKYSSMDTTIMKINRVG